MPKKNKSDKKWRIWKRILIALYLILAPTVFAFIVLIGKNEFQNQTQNQTQITKNNCPYEFLEACSDSKLGIPCSASLNITKGSDCRTACFGGKLSYECACHQSPVSTKWSFTSLNCEYECLNSPGNCIDYLDGHFCLPLSCSNGGTNCTTQCMNNTRSFKCNCSNNYAWNQSKLKCQSKCAKSLTDCATKDEDIDCISDNVSNKGLDCKTSCDNNTMSYKCDCLQEPVKMIWSNQNLTCQYKCVDEIGDCVEYGNNKTCLNTTEVNGGFNCKTQCINNTRSFNCECSNNYTWIQSKLKCQLICIKKIRQACIADLNCVPSVETFGGTSCFTLCDEGKHNYHCNCPAIMVWNYIYERCEKIMPCFKPDRPELQLYANCVALDLYSDNAVSGNNCRKCCNFDNMYTCSCPAPLYWNHDHQRCTPMCLQDTSVDCTNYVHGSACFKSKEDTFGAFNCKAICGRSGRNFRCSCYPPAVWEPTNHFCASFCPSGYDLYRRSSIDCCAYTALISCYKLVDTAQHTYAEAVTLCENKTARTHLPYVNNKNSNNSLKLIMSTNSITKVWNSVELIDNAWKWNIYGKHPIDIPIKSWVDEAGSTETKTYIDAAGWWHATDATDPTAKFNVICQYDAPT